MLTRVVNHASYPLNMLASIFKLYHFARFRTDVSHNDVGPIKEGNPLQDIDEGRHIGQ